MSLAVDFPAPFDDLNPASAATVTVDASPLAAAPGVAGASSSIEDLLEKYKENDPGVISFGGTLGVDGSAFRLELSNVYVSVVNVTNDDGTPSGKLLVIQGMAHFRIAKILSISAALIGEYDPDVLADPLELFNKDLDDDEKAEAVRARNAFGTATGDTIRRYNLIGAGKETNGLYLLLDQEKNLTDKQYVFIATGLMDFSWLKKIGVNCALKIGAAGAYNSFENSWEVGLGAKITVPSGTDWMAVGRVGFKGGEINTLAFEVRGEIPAGPVVFTQIKMGVTGMAETVQTYSPGLGVGFGPEVNFSALSSPVSKMLGLKVGKFRVVEVGVSGEIASDFQNLDLSVEGKLFGLLEIKGGWKRIDGTFNQINLSVGTKSAATFNFQISGSAQWGDGQVTVKGMLDGHFKWDFTALGVDWVGVNVGGGVNIIYNQTTSKKTLSIAVNGRAQVKVLFVKVGVNVAKNWFFDLSNRSIARSCTNERLDAAAPRRALASPAQGNGAPAGVSGEMIGSYSWVSSDLAAEGRTYITVAVQHSLVDLEWVLRGADGSVCTSTELNTPVTVKQVSFSQLELTVDNAARGDWTLEVYGSRNRNGEVCIFAEAGDPVETDVRIISADKTSVTLEYLAHATGESHMAALYMERADRPADEYEGTVLEYLDATGADEYRRITVDLPENVQGGMYQFYVMAQSTNCSETAYSAKTESVEILRRTAELRVTDYRVEFQAADPRQATVFCTVANLGSDDAENFSVAILLGDSAVNTDDDLVVAATEISLAAGERRDLQLALTVPAEFLGDFAVMSVRLDAENAVEESIFEENNTVMKTVAPAVSLIGGGKHLEWGAVAGASTYDLEYAVENDWDDSAAICGFTMTSADLGLAAGHYTFRVTPYDAEGKVIEPGITEWEDIVFLSSDYALAFDGTTPVSSGEFSLMDGFYDWSSTDLGDFSGTLTLNLVDGIRRGKDAAKMVIDVVDGEVTPGSETTGILLDNGLYYFTASGIGTASDLTFSIVGDVFPNTDPLRGVVSLPDCVDETGHYSETLENWVGAFDGEDRWEFLLEDAGELSLAINDPIELTSTLVVDLYVQSGDDGQYQRVKTFSIDASSSETLLDNYIVTNNFYVRVGASDNGRGEHNSEYSLNLEFTAFDDSELDDGEWFLSAGQDPILVNGWVGYRKSSETYLLTVEEGFAGKYDIRLTGDAGEATLNIRALSGKLIKSLTLNGEGVALISNFELYSGDYLVEIDSRNDVWQNNNTNYSLSVNRNEAFNFISENDPAEVRAAEQGEKLFFEVAIGESGVYDVSDLREAGLTVWFQEATDNGILSAAKLRPDWVSLDWDVPCYMTICNNTSAWGDTLISLDSENHKFVLSSIPAVG